MALSLRSGRRSRRGTPVPAAPGPGAPAGRGEAGAAGEAAGGEAGFTLMEVLITVALMSIAFVAILGALGTMIAAGSTHRALSTGEVAVRDLAEAVKSESLVPYVDCGSGPLASYSSGISNPATFDPPPGFSATVVSVTYWQGDAAGTFNSTCPSPDTGAQLVRLRVEGSSGTRPASQEVEVVKRKP